MFNFFVIVLFLIDFIFSVTSICKGDLEFEKTIILVEVEKETYKAIYFIWNDGISPTINFLYARERNYY